MGVRVMVVETDCPAEMVMLVLVAETSMDGEMMRTGW